MIDFEDKELNSAVLDAVSALTVMIAAQKEHVDEANEIQDKLFEKWFSDPTRFLASEDFWTWKKAEKVSDGALKMLCHLETQELETLRCADMREEIEKAWKQKLIRRDTEKPGNKCSDPAMRRQQNCQWLLDLTSTIVKSKRWAILEKL